MSERTYSAGLVTAYGAAVRGGYRGTYAEFCRQQAEYADNAAAVEQAKTEVQSAATSAAGSATSAGASATAAAGSATSAGASATAAAGSATTAGQHKDAAATSATNAASSATAAAASATSAATSASAAQAVLESIPEDYSDLSKDVDDLKADLGELSSTPSDIKKVEDKTKVLSVGIDSAEIYVSHSQPIPSSGIVEWVDDDTFTINGTPSIGASKWLFMNVKGTTSSVTVDRGETYSIKLETTTDTENLWVSIYVKHSDGSTEPINGKRTVSYHVRSDDKGVLFRIGLKTKVLIQETCKLTITKNITPLLVDNANAMASISVRLSTFGRCILGDGVFVMNDTIAMPSNSLLQGYSKGSVLRYTGNGTFILMNSRCSVKNLTIQGSDTDITLPDTDDDVDTKHAIEWTGESMEFGVVDSCIIEGFAGSAIYAHDTGTPTDRNLLVSNCVLRNNGIGVYIRKNSEYNKVVNCAIVKNTYGILSRGGNNLTDNCGIDSNKIGIKLDADEGSNNGHGNISNCTINHSNGNVGYGLIVDGTGRMVISNCNFYYSNIRLANGDGNIINGCGFGSSAIIEVAEGASSRTDIICNCMMRSTANVINVYSGIAKVSNCWTRAGIAVEATPVSA